MRQKLSRSRGQASAATAVFPREVKALLQQGLALRDRFAAEEVSAHGLKVATGRLEAALARLLDPCYRADENRRLANHLDREFPFLQSAAPRSGPHADMPHRRALPGTPRHDATLDGPSVIHTRPGGRGPPRRREGAPNLPFTPTEAKDRVQSP